MLNMWCAGGWLLATAHIVTAIIGAGVLGLPYALSWLGAKHQPPLTLVLVPACMPADMQ